MKFILSICVLGVLVFVSILGYILIQEHSIQKPTDYDSIIVLGAQVKEDGSLSKQLLLRLETALEAYKFKEVPIVTTGARGEKEPIEEAIAMKAWLISQGVPEDRVLVDIQSTSTRENILNAKEILALMDRQSPAIVTSDYHLPRALAIAKDLELRPQGFPSPTTKEYWIKNHFREVLSWVKYLAQKLVGAR